MPSHSHNYPKSTFNNTIKVKEDNSANNKCPCSHEYNIYNYRNNLMRNNFSMNSFYNNNIFNNLQTENSGSGYAHNNMPPYLAAYCWRRVM